MSKKKGEAAARNGNEKNEKKDECKFKQISSRPELKTFLGNVRDKLAESAAPPIHCVSAMHHVLNLPDVYDLFDAENKEIARDIWLRIKQHGLHLRLPPMLFADGEQVESAP